MATNNTVQLNIATTNTAKATKDVKSLKEQIRDLKNEMAGLTKGTAEYDAAAAELGDLMHQQTEITESAKLATADYGQTLSNITSISAGVVGSISAMNGVMNLIGASSDEATEAMRKIQSLMAIVQGLNQLDAAEKAFRGLMTRIKLVTAARKSDTQAEIANTAAGAANAASMKAQTTAATTLKVGLVSLGRGFKALGATIKAFMMSNPFTLAILGATALISLVTNLTNKTKEAAEEARRIKYDEAIAELNSMSKALNDMGGDMSNKLKIDTAREKLDELRNGAQASMEQLKEYMEMYKEQIKQIQKDLDIARLNNGEDSEEAKKKYDELLKVQSAYYLTAMDYYDQYVNSIRNKIEVLQKFYDSVLDSAKEEFKKQIDEQEDLLKQAEQDYETSGIQFFDHYRGITVNGINEAEKQRKKEEQAAAEAKRKADERRARELNDIKTAYERQKQLTNDLYRDQELTSDEYYDRQITELNNYLEKWKNLKIKHNKELKKSGLTEGLTQEDLLEIERMNSQAVDLERKKVEAIIELNKKVADSRNYRGPRAIVGEARYQDAQNAMTDESGKRYAEQQEELFNAWWLKKFTLIEKYNQREIEVERAHNDELNSLAMERYAEEKDVLDRNLADDKSYEKTSFDNEMKYLQEKLDAKLISQQEYNLAVEQLEREHQERMDELQNEYDSNVQEIEANRIETLRDIVQQRYEIEKDYYDRRLELDEAYIAAYQSVTSAIGGILAEAQQAAKEGTKEYEQIQEASIIMDTISGSLAAFMSGVKSGIPAPYNFILAGVLSAAALVEGQLALNNLHSKKLSAGASNAPSVSAYQTVAYETGADIQGEIRDQRVYVTETDIADTLDRVNVIETESTF